MPYIAAFEAKGGIAVDDFAKVVIGLQPERH